MQHEGNATPLPYHVAGAHKNFYDATKFRTHSAKSSMCHSSAGQQIKSVMWHEVEEKLEQKQKQHK